MPAAKSAGSGHQREAMEAEDARFMRFADLGEVNERARELRRIGKAWCAMQAKKPNKRS